VVLSDTWLTYDFGLSPGAHKLEWVYKKINEIGVSDDLSAEIEYIKITGVKGMNKECQTCHRGVASESRDRCLMCGANEFLDEDSYPPSCLSCDDDEYSPPGTIGRLGCIPRPTCRDEDYSFDLGEGDGTNRVMKFALREP